jgi:hypothetical protein
MLYPVFLLLYHTTTLIHGLTQMPQQQLEYLRLC